MEQLFERGCATKLFSNIFKLAGEGCDNMTAILI